MLAVPCMETITKCFGDASVEKEPEGKSFDELWPAYEAKMKAEGLSAAAIAAFKYNFGVLTSGADLNIPESSIMAVDALPTYEALKGEKPALLKETVMVKLNGGLGTGMGLEKAKSLLELKDGLTFLDFIAKQVTRTQDGGRPASPSSRDDKTTLSSGDRRDLVGPRPVVRAGQDWRRQMDHRRQPAMRVWAAREQPRRPSRDSR